MEKYTEEELRAINDYLLICVRNSSLCKNCHLYHENGGEPFCFFASDCIQKNFSHFKCERKV